MMPKTENPFENLQPEEVVKSYYEGLNHGDLESIKNLMTEKSYFMTLESLGLKLAFRDAAFKQALGEIEENATSLQKVEQQLSEELSSRNTSPELVIEKVEPNGTERMTVHYTQDGKVKNLYFSKEKNAWKINYYAGRKVD